MFRGMSDPNKFYLPRATAEIFSSGTCLFVFIAGFLFQHLSSKYEFKNYMKKKFINVISPYLITSIPGIILCLTIPKIYHHNPIYGVEPKFLQVFMFYTTGHIHNGPTWYILMTTMFFLIASFLLFLEKKNILYKILPVLLLITIFTQRLHGYIDIETIVTAKENYFFELGFWFLNFIRYLPVYILGMYFSAHKEHIEKLYNHRFILILLMIISSIVDILLLKLHFLNGDISKIFFALVVLGYLKHYDEKIMSMAKINSIMDFIAKYSFGIFFIHGYIIDLFNSVCKFYLPKLREMQYVYTYTLSDIFTALSFDFIKFIFALSSSILICYVIKKILEKLGVKNTRAIIGA